MATSKTPAAVNYTPEQTAELIAAYVANPTAETVAAFAEKLGKTTKSIIAKLSREKVYKAKEYTTKAGETPVKKDELADEMAEMFGLSEGEADSLTKANKTALRKVIGAHRALMADYAAFVDAETTAETQVE